jgi:signal peptidase II
MSTIGIGLLIGGAAGNLIDRLFRGDDGVLRGSVVDFIDLQWFPIFNVADMAINVGAGLLILNSILSARAHRHDDGEAVESEQLEGSAGGGGG